MPPFVPKTKNTDMLEYKLDDITLFLGVID